MANYTECLNETYNLFKSQGVNIIGEGFKEVITSPTLFEGYVTSLVEGLSADSQEQIAQLLANANNHILTEGAVGGIAPISSLTGPVIRKLWPSFAMKNAVATEVAKTPAFMINYTRPYYVTAGPNGEEERHYIPRPGLINGNVGARTVANDINGSYKTVEVTLTNGTATYDFKYANGTSGEYSPFLKANTASAVKFQPLDADFELVGIKTATFTKVANNAEFDSATVYYVFNAQTGKYVADTTVKAGNFADKKASLYTDNDTDATNNYIAINKKLGVENAIYADVKVGDDDVTILVRVDLNYGVAKVAAIGGAANAAVILKAHRSPEYNEITTSWSFDIAREDIRIGAGEHMNSPLSIESLTDMKALYQLDGTKMAVELMTNAMALDVDGRILAFLQDNFLNQPGHAEFGDYPGASQYTAIFDIKAEVGFAGGPKAWREELKPVIDHVAARIKNQTFLRKGHFNLVGNPLDIMLITNINWTFRAGQNAVDGVDVDYSVGTYFGSSNTYKIVSTEIVPQGYMYLVFIPSAEENQLTYKYWAYTFSTELGYRDPNRAMVPSVMLCKRDVMKAFLPAIGMIQILNNTPDMSYAPFRDVLPTKAQA